MLLYWFSCILSVKVHVCVGQISPCQWALWSQRLIPPSSTQQSSCGTWRKELLSLCRYPTQALFVLPAVVRVAPPGTSKQSCSPSQLLHFLCISLFVCRLNCHFWNPITSADFFRCTASAQSSLPGSTAERRASPSGSRLTPSSRETLESTQSTSTLPPAKSKSLRFTCFHEWRWWCFPPFTYPEFVS